MACPISRSQLQKQSSVDHEDGSEISNDLSELNTNLSELPPDVPENDAKNVSRSVLFDEYYSLKSKIDAMYERNVKNPVTDDLKEPMLNFIVRTLSSDKPADCQHLHDCYHYINMNIFSAIQAQNCVEKNNISDPIKISVEWENQDSRARMIMHKLCAFFGLQHNIIGQQFSSTIKIDFDSNNFIDWGCSIEELSRYLELKKILNIHDHEDSSPEAKTILKRTSSNRQQSVSLGHSESRPNNKTYEDRHNRYYQLRKQLGLPQGEPVDLPIKKNQKSVKQMHSMPTHDINSRDQLIHVKLNAQQRSATTDHDRESNFVDSSHSNSDFMSGDSVVLFHDSTSGVSSPSEVVPVMMQYPLSDDTLVYKLVATKLSSMSADDDVYIVPPGTNNPSLLLTNDGKPFRYKAGASLTGFCVQSIPLYLNNCNTYSDEQTENKEGNADLGDHNLPHQNAEAKQTNNNSQSAVTLTRQYPHAASNFEGSYVNSGCNIQPPVIPMPSGDNSYHSYSSNVSNYSPMPQQYSRPLVATATQPPQIPTPPVNQQTLSAVPYFHHLSGSEYAPIQINNANVAANAHNASMQICAPHAPPLLSGQHNLHTYLSPGVMPYQAIMLPPHYLVPPQTPHSLPRYVQPQSYINQLSMQTQSPVIPQTHHQPFPIQNIPSVMSYTNSGQFFMQHPPFVVQSRGGQQQRNSRPNRQSNLISNTEESQ